MLKPWTCPKTLEVMHCHCGFDPPTRANCFQCGLELGYGTCLEEMDGGEEDDFYHGKEDE